jgi:hypothetical protein
LIVSLLVLRRPVLIMGSNQLYVPVLSNHIWTLVGRFCLFLWFFLFRQDFIRFRSFWEAMWAALVGVAVRLLIWPRFIAGTAWASIRLRITVGIWRVRFLAVLARWWVIFRVRRLCLWLWRFLLNNVWFANWLRLFRLGIRFWRFGFRVRLTATWGWAPRWPTTRATSWFTVTQTIKTTTTWGTSFSAFKFLN